MYSLKIQWLATSLLVSIGITGAALASGAASDGPVRCGIEASTAGAMVSLEGEVASDAAVNGTYRFIVESVAGSGNSTIRQGGSFSAAAGETVTLGRVMLANNGIYDATLEVEAAGTRFGCEKRIGDSL